jgi:hypothetical protein
MNRLVRVLTALALCFAAACSSDKSDKVTITLFRAAPDAVELGQSTRLLFVVDPSDAQASINGVGDVTGKTEAVVTPTATTTYRLTVTKGKATADTAVTVTVGPRKAVSLKLTPPNDNPASGQQFTVTVSAIDATGAAAIGFGGTVHLTSSDAAALLPADFGFAPAEAAVKQVAVTLQTAGTGTLTAVDTTGAAASGSATMKVKHGVATSCAIAQSSSTSVAGAAVGITVAMRDAFGNPATEYAGTVRFTSTDGRAILPPDTTFAPASDDGSHAFAATLFTTGAQTMTATDVANAALHCNAAISVSPAAMRIVLSMPGNANAGYPIAVGLAVKDLFDNAIPNYAGTVTFTSSDTGAGAVTPSPLTFTGSEGGIGTTFATFVSLGAQTLTASDGGTPAASGSATSTVHGLAYTAPTAGRVRLVANAVQTNTQVVQLDLVATERLEISSFFGGGPGSFAAGMNLPLDTTRVGGDTTLFTPGAALPPPPPGTGTRAAMGRIGAADHVLYTVVARKRVAGSIFTQVTEVQSGQVFYSVRLKLQQTATPGPVFDGAQPSPLFRASVRDQFGNDFITQSDFGIGKLEVR